MAWGSVPRLGSQAARPLAARKRWATLSGGVELVVGGDVWGRFGLPETEDTPMADDINGEDDEVFIWQYLARWQFLKKVGRN